MWVPVGNKNSNVLDKVRKKAPNAVEFAWDSCHKIYVIENESYRG